MGVRYPPWNFCHYEMMVLPGIYVFPSAPLQFLDSSKLLVMKIYKYKHCVSAARRLFCFIDEITKDLKEYSQDLILGILANVATYLLQPASIPSNPLTV